MALKLGDLSKVPPKQKVFLTVLVCLIGGVADYYLYYQSASREIDTLQGQLSELQSKIKEQEVIARNLPSFQAEVKRLEEQLALLLDQLPNFAEIPVAISVNGEYHGFALFADKVSHLPRIVNLSEIVFSQPKDLGEDRIQVTVTCTAPPVRFVEQEGAGKGGKGSAR